MATPVATYYSDITWTLGSTDALQVGVPNADDTTKPKMQYCLYDNPVGFEAYTAYASNGANLPTAQMTKNLLAYESYSLQIVCDVSSSKLATSAPGVTPVTYSSPYGTACCLADASDSNGGGYCMVYTAVPPAVAGGPATPGFLTYYLTNSAINQ